MGPQKASSVSMKGVHQKSSGRNDGHHVHVKMGNGHVMKALPCHNNEEFDWKGIRK